jgi:hypothetical protein
MNTEQLNSRQAPQFHMSAEDRRRLEGLPWQVPLEEWTAHGIVPLSIRRGESRHPVIFLERDGARYAIKETTPHMAEREIHNLCEIERRGIPVLTAVGTVRVAAPGILLDTHGPGGLPQYTSGDRGYTVTRLAPRVIPHALLFRLPFTKRTKQHLLSAVALLMVELHEHGVYWGDPSLANVLIRIDGRSVLAIMADAETAELFSGPISEGLREQDLELFGESLTWQAEDLRIARGLPEEEELVGEKDFLYFRRRYGWLRRQHAQLIATPPFITLYQIQHVLEGLNQWGYSILGTTGKTFHELTTVLPGWYARRIHELLHISVPRMYARRFYNMIIGHQAIMSEHQGHEVSLEEAAKDWYSHYHLPAILLLRNQLTNKQDPLKAYFSIMDHKWKLSKKAGYEIPLDEAVVDWAMEQAAGAGKLGTVDPAMLATWWRERKPVANVLEPPLIEGEKLKPLLSEQERPLVHLSPPLLEDHVNGILRQQEGEETQ